MGLKWCIWNILNSHHIILTENTQELNEILQLVSRTLGIRMKTKHNEPGTDKYTYIIIDIMENFELLRIIWSCHQTRYTKYSEKA